MNTALDRAKWFLENISDLVVLISVKKKSKRFFKNFRQFKDRLFDIPDVHITDRFVRYRNSIVVKKKIVRSTVQNNLLFRPAAIVVYKNVSHYCVQPCFNIR